jgi:hypothetical protein
LAEKAADILGYQGLTSKSAVPISIFMEVECTVAFIAGSIISNWMNKEKIKRNVFKN